MPGLPLRTTAASSASDAHPRFFLTHAPCVGVGDLARALGADVLGDEPRDQIRTHAGKHLRDAAAGGVAPHHQVTQSELGDQAGQVADVVLDQIAALRVPGRVAVPAHVVGDHVVRGGEVRGHRRRTSAPRGRCPWISTIGWRPGLPQSTTCRRWPFTVMKRSSGAAGRALGERRDRCEKGGQQAPQDAIAPHEPRSVAATERCRIRAMRSRALSSSRPSRRVPPVLPRRRPRAARPPFPPR